MDVAVLRLLLWHGDLAFWCLFWWQETNILCQNMSICWNTKLRMIAFHKTCCFYIVPYCVLNLQAHISTDFTLCAFKSPTQRTIEITSCMPFSSKNLSDFSIQTVQFEGMLFRNYVEPMALLSSWELPTLSVQELFFALVDARLHSNRALSYVRCSYTHCEDFWSHPRNHTI